MEKKLDYIDNSLYHSTIPDKMISHLYNEIDYYQFLSEILTIADHHCNSSKLLNPTRRFEILKLKKQLRHYKISLYRFTK